jgi:hypothetical protein
MIDQFPGEIRNRQWDLLRSYSRESCNSFGGYALEMMFPKGACGSLEDKCFEEPLSVSFVRLEFWRPSSWKVDLSEANKSRFRDRFRLTFEIPESLVQIFGQYQILGGEPVQVG